MSGLTEGCVRRILLALIAQAQSDAGHSAGISDTQRIAALSLDRSAAQIDALAVDDATLGFDSIARLTLINRVTTFFQLSDSGAEDYLLLTPSIGRWIQVIQAHTTRMGPDLAFGFTTSGSTGEGRVQRHSLVTLMEEVHAIGSGVLPPFGSRARIVALVPPHHIYGFIHTCLVPATFGLEVIDVHTRPPSALARLGQPGDVAVGTPFNWQMVAAAGLALPAGIHGITSGGPSTSETWFEQGIARPADMLEIYGATETGGIGYRRAQEEAFALLPHLARTADCGIARQTSKNTTLPVQDRLIWEGADRFRLGGRLDHVVQVAGVNVRPTQIAQTICAVDGVSDAAVRPDEDRLKGFIVPEAGVTDLDALETRIRDHLRRVLNAPSRVGHLTFGGALPRNIMGKLCDWSTQANGTVYATAKTATKMQSSGFLIN